MYALYILVTHKRFILNVRANQILYGQVNFAFKLNLMKTAFNMNK